MKRLQNVRYGIGAFAIAAMLCITTQSAQAQTQNMTATVGVQNTLTLTVDNELDFGIIVAISDAVNQAYIAVNPTTGLLGAATNNAPAYMASLDNTTVSEGQITVTDGADTATINITVDNVVDPINGGNSFILDNFTSSWNGGPSTPRALATPWPQVYADNAGAGSVLDLGARITTDTAVATYLDATYVGGYDVIFSY